MRRFLAVTFVTLLAGPALAQDTGETTREVVGFGPDNKVVVRAISQGERIVDGSAKSYWFELDELWDARLATPLDAHRRGEPTGLEHPAWKKAQATPLEFEPWAEGQLSPDSNRLVVTVARTDTRPGDQGWVCTTTARTVLMSRQAGAAFNVGEKSAVGEPASRESAAECPRLQTRSGWSRDSKRFVVERRLDGELSLVVGSTDATGAYAESPMRRGGAIDPLGSLSVGPLRTAWEALLANDTEAANQALAEQAEETGWTKLARAWAAARSGDTKGAAKIARGAEKDVKGDPIGLAMLGGAYALTNDNRRTKRALDQALKSAKTWKQYVQMAVLLRDVDLSLYNQVLVYGLSSDEGKASAEPWAWRLLIDGLVDANLADKGAALVDKIPEDAPARAGAQARIQVGAGKGNEALPLARDMMWADIGNCDAYLLAGRAELLRAAPADALDLLRAASFCDPKASEAWYFLAELHRAAGRAVPAVDAAESFMKVTPSRRNDAIRDLRRDRAQKTLDRMATDGLGLVSLTCRRLGPAYLCQGVVVNGGANPVEGAIAVIMKGDTELGRSDLPTVPPTETRSFGIRVESLDDAVFSAGRDEDEKKRNTVTNLKRGW